MIRINLLPHKKAAIVTSPVHQRWLVVLIGVLVIEIVGLFFWHEARAAKRDDLKRKNAESQGAIDIIKKRVADHEEVKKQLATLRAREDAIAKLEGARTGPTAAFLELTQVLTPGRGPTIDQEKLAAQKQDTASSAYNNGWDPRRLWLTAYSEVGRTVRLEGMARDGNDVSEFAQRLRLSSYFYEVTLLPGKKEAGKDLRLELVNFALQLKVRY